LKEASAAAESITVALKECYDTGANLKLLMQNEEPLLYELRNSQLDARRFAATVRLIKAVRGGWEDRGK